MSDDRADSVRIWEETIHMPTYEAGTPDPNPMFLERRVYQGSSGKVYPLAVTETLSDERILTAYHAVFLENKYLKVMVLPELGGRIHRATDKTNNYDFVYYNQVIKPALVGLAGPWISGGIEFNWPQHHRPSTFSPVEYKIETHEDGSKTLWVGEIDVMYGTKGMAGFTLYPDRAYIEVRGQLYNRTSTHQTFLWWANPAVAVNDSTYSVFPPDVHAVMDHGKRAVSTFPIATGEYYKFDYSAGIDISRYKNIQVPTSYMAYHSDYDFIGNYDESQQAGLLHVADHHFAPGKKQWTWGNGDFGRAWDRNLTDSDGPYIELMTGVYTDNQPDFTWLAPHEEKRFTQYFLPYKQVGKVSDASKDIVLRFEQFDNRFEIAVYATSSYPDAEIRIEHEGEILYRRITELSADVCFEDEFECATCSIYATQLIVRDKTGSTLIRYIPEKQQEKPMPAPAIPLPLPSDVKTTEELFLGAMHLIQYRHASYSPVEYFLEGLRRDPSDIRLNDGYGTYLYSQGYFQASLPYFKRAINRLQWKNPNPYTSLPFYHLGLAQFMTEDYEGAYESFFKATWTADTQNVAWYRLACLSLRKEQFEMALECVEKALVYNWHDMKSRLVKAILLRKHNKNTQKWIEESKAIDPLDHSIAYEDALCSHNPDSWQALMRNESHNYLLLALTYDEIGDVEHALNILSFAPENNPMIIYARGYLTYKAYRDTDKAIKLYRQANSLSPLYCFPNTLEEMKILQHAIEFFPQGGFASYYLGNLFYDFKRYDDALECWKRSAALNPDFSTVHRNLSIVYHNYCHDNNTAFEEICIAQQLDETDARILLERDQLAEKIGHTPRQRLLFLDQFGATVNTRDDLYLRRIILLNCLGHYQQAYEAIERRKFHPWEGGEGLVSGQYVFSLINIAKRLIDDHEEQQAIKYLEKTFVWPQNLGEGRLPHTQDTIACYYLGVAYDLLARQHEATYWWEKASIGLEKPSEAHYYNDQPSDTIFYQGLAWIKLGVGQQARKRFHTLVTYGQQHQFDTVQPDYFAVSLPETSVYHENSQKKHILHCRYHMALGKLGLGEIDTAKDIFSDILRTEPSHQGALRGMRLCEQWPDC